MKRRKMVPSLVSMRLGVVIISSLHLLLLILPNWPVAVCIGDTSRQLLGLRGGGIGGTQSDGLDQTFGHSDNVPLLRSTSSTTTTMMTKKKTATSVTPPAANMTVPLHAHSGTHHVHVYIGSPPQRQTLIVDTGSRVMAFPCRPCRSCGNHASPYFDQTISTTARTSTCGHCLLEGIATCSLFGNQCEISQKYTEGSSWSATEVEDMVWLGTPDVVESVEVFAQSAIPYAFGCQTNSKGLFKKQYADGILGLARHESSLIAAYAQAAAIPRNAFSLCMSQQGGHLSIGGSLSPQHHEEPMRVTPITREHGWYSVEVVKLLVGDMVIASDGEKGADEVSVSDDYSSSSQHLLRTINGGKGCILDSGTTDTYLPSVLSKSFGSAVKEWTKGLTDFSNKVRQKTYTYEEFQKLPEITFIFANDVRLSMRPENYMEGVPLHTNDEKEEAEEEGQVQPWVGSKLLTNRIYLEESEGAVLGANAMFGYDILFDTRGHQVGIAQANCMAKVD